MTDSSTSSRPARVWHFKPADDRSDVRTMRTGTQLNADELRRVMGHRLDRAEHVEEPTQVWRHGTLTGVLVSPTWFEVANRLMREHGHDHAAEDYEPLPARSDSPSS